MHIPGKMPMIPKESAQLYRIKVPTIGVKRREGGNPSTLS